MVLSNLWRWQTTLNCEIPKLAWYSPSGTHQICLSGLKLSLGIHGFKPAWPYLIIEVLATLENLLKPSRYTIVINCPFPFHTTNFLWLLSLFMAQFVLMKHKFLNLQVHFKSYMKWSNAQHVSTPTTTILPTTAWTASVMWYMHHKLTCTKNCKTFDSP